MPSLFTNDHVVLALVNSLRKDIGSGLKTTNKSNIFLNIMFINLLVKAFSDVANWPDIFVKVRNVKINEIFVLTMFFKDVCGRCCS